MDARLNVHALLGIAEGDAHIIRNAGGVVTDDGHPLPGHFAAAAGHRRDHAHPPHGLLHDDLPRRRGEGRHSGRHSLRSTFALEDFGDLEGDVRQQTNQAGRKVTSTRAPRSEYS